MKRLPRLKRIFEIIMEEAENNAVFAGRLQTALAEEKTVHTPPRLGRRKPGVFDPFSVYPHGEDALRSALEGLQVEQLKDIVAEHGMDLSKLAMKWKTPQRLVDLIVATVRSRSQKGDAFRGGAR